MSSSPSSSICLLCQDLENYRSVDFLGFNIETYLNSHEVIASPYFHHLSEDESEKLTDFLDVMHLKLRLKADSGRMFLLKVAYAAQEAPAISLAQQMMHDINTGISGHHDSPMLVNGRASIKYLNGSYIDPDQQFLVQGRNHSSPNFAQETDYRHDQTMVQIHDRLKYTITGTAGVMLVMGVKIFDREIDGTFAAVACLYERGQNAPPQLTHNISFGTTGLSALHLNSWNAATNNFPLTGVGASGPAGGPAGGSEGGPACSALGIAAYQLPLRADYMLNMAIDFPVVISPACIAAIAGANFNVDLYGMQRAIDLRL